MRAFLAVELPEDVRAVIERGLGPLKRDLPPARWVRSESIHITLKFLGEQPEELLRRLAVRLGALARSLAPAPIELGGGGFFPNPRRPRVAWVGGVAPDLPSWAEAAEACAEELGVAREARPFSLHLTLARLEKPWGASAVEDFVVRVGKWSFPAFVARELILFRSELRPSGAVYTPLARVPVGE